jgi:hypothetical protein
MRNCLLKLLTQAGGLKKMGGTLRLPRGIAGLRPKSDTTESAREG